MRLSVGDGEGGKKDEEREMVLRQRQELGWIGAGRTPPARPHAHGLWVSILGYQLVLDLVGCGPLGARAAQRSKCQLEGKPKPKNPLGRRLRYATSPRAGMLRGIYW